MPARIHAAFATMLILGLLVIIVGGALLPTAAFIALYGVTLVAALAGIARVIGFWK